jgi:hypothetical protein
LQGRRGASSPIDGSLATVCGAIGLTIEDTLRLCLQAMRALGAEGQAR